MYYKIFDTQQEALDFSRAEALRRGCTGVTQYWYSHKLHEDGRCALVSSEPVEGFDDLLDESWNPKQEEL